jgi:hypothetical protein
MEHHIKVTVVTDDKIESSLAVAQALNDYFPLIVQLNPSTGGSLVVRSAWVMPDEHEALAARLRTFSDVVHVALYNIAVALGDSSSPTRQEDVVKLMEWIRQTNEAVRYKTLGLDFATDSVANVAAGLMAIDQARTGS